MDDWQEPGAEVIAERLVSGARPGAIVLLHDGGGDRTQTVEALAPTPCPAGASKDTCTAASACLGADIDKEQSTRGYG